MLLPGSFASSLSLCLLLRRLFELAGEHRLDIAHPSLCSDLDSTSLNIEFNRVNPHRVLRFTSWVDSLAPLFSFSFFQESVVATLENAHSGGAEMVHAHHPDLMLQCQLTNTHSAGPNSVVPLFLGRCKSTTW